MTGWKKRENNNKTLVSYKSRGKIASFPSCGIILSSSLPHTHSIWLCSLPIVFFFFSTFLARRPRGGRLMWCGNVCNCQTVDNHIYLRFLSEHTFSSGVFNEGLAQNANQRRGVSWGKEENHLITLDISYPHRIFFLSLFRPARQSD